ncbi:RNA-binding protein lark-like [Haliotis cracherodii]|uniref:RNA-binding protein 4.1-like n=1 Tax=Haliotis rufescens TaxID=6454 RepID=UPI001EB02763|nr:RNA-binding protein 4.1-like [Haliotis rufescens]
MPTKIFIGNLGPDTQAQDLRPLFEKYGHVSECDVLRNYGFVHMSDDNEAQVAITELDGYSIHGHRMRVERSTGKRGEGGGKDRARGGGRGRGRGGIGRGSGRGSPRGGGGGIRDSYGSRYPPPHPYDRYDPYYRYPYPERDPYYRPPPPSDRYPPRMPPPPPPGDRYPPRDRLPAGERPLPPPDRRAAYPDPRDRMLPPPRDRYGYPEERSPYERSPYERARPLDVPSDPYYRERSPVARPPPEYYERPLADYPPPARRPAQENGQGYPNGYDYYSKRPDYRDLERPVVSSHSAPQYQQPRMSGAGSTSAQKNPYDSQSLLQTGPIFF